MKTLVSILILFLIFTALSIRLEKRANAVLAALTERVEKLETSALARSPAWISIVDLAADVLGGYAAAGKWLFHPVPELGGAPVDHGQTAKGLDEVRALLLKMKENRAPPSA
jgi:uncharacterized protein (DUF2384 family)